MIHCPICGVTCGNEQTLRHHAKEKHDMNLLAVETIEPIETTNDHESTFQDGQWVDLVDNHGRELNAFVLNRYNKFCVLEIIGVMPNKPYKPIRGSVLNPIIKAASSELNEQDLDLLIDLSLSIGDPEWFQVLTDKKRVRS